LALESLPFRPALGALAVRAGLVAAGAFALDERRGGGWLLPR